MLWCLGVAAALAVVGTAQAAGDPSIGYDISYPNCGSTFPSGAFGIVGVNGGKPFAANPCLGAGNGASELAWAGVNADLYANTADPGPALSSHWPNGQTAPQPCNTAASPGPDLPGCHYDYGWNAAADSYTDAVNAAVSLGWAPAGSTRTPVANVWWLDVETANSWTATTSLNVQALQGELDYLASVGAARVGFYSSPAAWQAITGGTAVFSAFPGWLAGAGSLADAQSRCGGSGFTQGGIALTQFGSGGVDNDYRCAQQSTLAFGTAPQKLTAGSPSAAMSVQFQQPTPAATTVALSTSSAGGRFATSPGGPWSSSLGLAVPAGATASGSFYYEDTKAASPVLTATASGYPNATQTETVTAAALAAITISPASPKLRVGARVSLAARGADRYGNPVGVSPSWRASPAVGRFTPTAGNPTTFAARTAGTGRITATAGGVSGTTSVTVSSGKQSRRRSRRK